MDIDVIDEEGQHENTDDGDDDYNEGGELNSAGISVVQKNDVDAEPHVGMKFDSASSAKTFYDDYARRMGFSIRAVQHIRAKCDGVVVREFVCARDSSNRISGDNCDAMLRIELKNHAEWVVAKFIKEHSHSTMGPSKVHYLRPRRHFAGGEKTMAENYQGVIPNGVMSVLVDGNHAALETDHCAKSTIMDSNHAVKNSGPLNYVGRHVVQKMTLGRDAQNLMDYFKKMQAQNPGFYYAVQLDDDNRIASVFWADSKSRTAYSNFGDTVTLDTSYRVNQYRVPVAPFTGVNHHGQPILFGCALLYDESDAAYVWLLKTFLSAMSDHAPVSIVTESDKSLQSAVFQVFPEARHCISKWHMLREGHERLGHICHAHPNFQVDLYNCINLTDTIEEFELAWDSILDKYDVRRNEWLQSLYGKRTLWAPVYFRDAFFAAISLTQRFEGSFFDGYVNQETTVPLFFRQYERALENSFRKEKEADYDTICTAPVLRTPSPMEKQAANLYTRKIFLKFQEELVETFVYTANRIDGDEAMSTFRVAKFEDDHKAYTVSLNLPAMRANCSCQMFEYSGILCRHILTVFTVTNVLTLPSHYILRRWTRNAKSWVGSDDRGELAQESLAVRYNNLCREAIKYAEEGATAPETYNAAMTALREGWKKVLSVKKNVAKVAPPSSHVSVIGYEDRRTSTPDMTPLLWPRQDEAAQCFNLNDGVGTAQSIADLNLPRMAPVSLRRDVGQSDNMVFLPCLKSMTWVMENKNSIPANRLAVISLKLQDYSRVHSAESEVKFQLSTLTLEPMLRSMAYISEQLSTPANRVAVINLKLQDTETTSGESEVKFQVSRDTLAAMLRSMAYIREQLANQVESHVEMPPKKSRR